MKIFLKKQADVLVDIECDSKYLEHVIRLLKREVQSVNYASTIANADIPSTPLSKCGSFGKNWNQKLGIFNRKNILNRFWRHDLVPKKNKRFGQSTKCSYVWFCFGC